MSDKKTKPAPETTDANKTAVEKTREKNGWTAFEITQSE
jgi:hypothetical protein